MTAVIIPFPSARARQDSVHEQIEILSVPYIYEDWLGCADVLEAEIDWLLDHQPMPVHLSQHLAHVSVILADARASIDDHIVGILS